MKKIINKRSGQISINKTYTAEPLEIKIAKLLETGSGIEQTEGGEYSEEYLPGNDIRTDRFEVALNGMIKGEIIEKQEKARLLQKKTLNEENVKKSEEEKRLNAENEMINKIAEKLKNEQKTE
jgi:hypothetical protein